MQEWKERPLELFEGKYKVRKVALSPSRIVVVKEEFSNQSSRLKKFYNVFNLAIKQDKIHPEKYELENYKYYKTHKAAKTHRISVAKYYLRPTVLDALNNIMLFIKQPLLFKEIHKIKEKEKGLSLAYTKRIYEKSGLTPKKFLEKLNEAHHEFFNDAIMLNNTFHFNVHDMIMPFEKNSIVQGYDKNAEKFIFTLIDPR